MTNNNNLNKEKDAVTGVETTGHEWDGLKELNNPAPRWWLMVFYVTVVWSIGYWVVYPAWPTIENATVGKLGWTQYKQLAASQAEIHARQEGFINKIEQSSLDTIKSDKELYEVARHGGEVAFKNNCSACHGTGAAGAKGYPNLNDNDWLWGGKLEDIATTIRYGIRSTHEKTRYSAMPAFGTDGILKAEEISNVADYVLSLSGKGAANDKGKEIFAQQCAACHGPEGKGMREMGAPNLTDAIWLFGGEKEAVVTTISKAHNAVMPTWEEKLNDATIKQLAIYVHSLGGGE